MRVMVDRSSMALLYRWCHPSNEGRGFAAFGVVQFALSTKFRVPVLKFKKKHPQNGGK
jgi:hypothetical protein